MQFGTKSSWPVGMIDGKMKEVYGKEWQTFVDVIDESRSGKSVLADYIVEMERFVQRK